MTLQELHALVQILNRAPMTQGELIFVNALVSREEQQIRERTAALDQMKEEIIDVRSES